MEKKMDSFKQKGRLSRRFSSRKSLVSLKTRFKKFLSDHHSKAVEGGGRSSSSSDSETDRRKTSRPPPDRSGETKKSLSSSSSSDSDEGRPSEPTKQVKSDSSSDSSSERKRKKGPPGKSSRKKLQQLPQQQRHEASRLPALEETPPPSPQSNPRLSTGAQSDYGRLWKHASAPNSPANLAHNLNLNYRGGDSSPVALIHSLSAREPGKRGSPLSEISCASPPSSSSLELDVLGVKLDDLKGSPSKTTPSLKPSGLPIVHHDEEQGVWTCDNCGWIYPNPNPSLRNRRLHKRHCGEITNVQRWLGAQDIQDAPEEGSVGLERSLEGWDGSGALEKLSTADEHPMAKSDEKDEGASEKSTDPHGNVDQGTLNESDGSPDHHAVGDEGNDWRNLNAGVDSYEDQDQVRVNRLPEGPTAGTEIKDQSSSGQKLSSESANYHDGEDQSKLQDASNGSAGHLGIKEIKRLDDSVNTDLERSDPVGGAVKITSEVQNEKAQPVATEANLEEVFDDVESTQMFDSELEAHDSELNQTLQEKTESDAGDAQVQPLNDNGKLETSGKQSFATVHPNGQDLVHFESTEGVKDEQNESANQESREYLSHPHDTGVTEDLEIRSEQLVLTNGNGIAGGQSPMNEDDIGNQTPCDDGFNFEAGTVQEVESMEPSVTPDMGQLIDKAEVMQKSEELKPSLSSADRKDREELVDNEIGEIVDHESLETENGKRNGNALKDVALEGTKVDSEVPKLAEPSQSQNGHLKTQNSHSGTEKDVRLQDHEIPDYSSQREVAEMDSVEGSLTQESPAQKNDTRTDDEGRLTGSSSPLEEAPKWVNSEMVTSQGEGDTFSSVQKYWADVSRSGYLLVDGKRSPSLSRSDDVEFPSYRNGEGRRSPSPFSLSKTEHGEIQSLALEDPVYRSTMEDNDEDRAIPSVSPLSTSEHAETRSSTPEDSVKYQSTAQKGDEDKAIRVFPHSKSEHGEFQSSSPVDSVNYQSTMQDKDEDRAVDQQHGSSSSLALVDYDVEKVVHEQNTHDLICPICGSDVTKRIILRRRKRTRAPEDDGDNDQKVLRLDSGRQPQLDDSDDETWGCLACLSFFKLKAVVFPSSDLGDEAGTEERVRCLPNLFQWGPGTPEPELQQPLLDETSRREAIGEIAEPPPAVTHEVPLDDDEQVSCFSYLQRSKSQPPAPEVSASSVSDSGLRDVPNALERGPRREESPSRGSDIARERGISEPEESTPVNVSRVHAAPSDGDEQVTCLSYLQGVNLCPGGKSFPEAPGSAKGEDSGELAEPKPDTAGVSHEIPNNEDEQVSCFSYLQRSKSQFRAADTSLPDGSDSSYGVVSKKEPRNKGASMRQDIPASNQNIEQEPSVQDEAEELPKSNLQAEMENEEPIVSKEVEEPGETSHERRDQEQVSTLQLPHGIGVLQPRVNNATTVSEEKDKCECLPFFSFRSKSSFSVNRVTNVTASLEGTAQSDSASSTTLPTREFHPTEDPDQEGSSDFLPASVPAFPWGTSSKYELPSSPKMPSSHQESTSATERREKVTSGSATTPLLQDPPALGDAEEKRSCNCLPELLPTFSWGPIPAYNVPLLDAEESSEIEGPKEATAETPTTSLTRESQAPEEAGEKRNCNCLPELLPAFSWGPIPVYNVPPLDTDEFPEIEGQEEATTENRTASLIQESQVPAEAKWKTSSNCLPLPAFSWGSIPVYSAPPLDTDESSGIQGPQEAPIVSLTQDSQASEDAREKSRWNCLPGLPPAFSWGTIPVDNLTPPVTEDYNPGRQLPSPDTAGRIHEVPLDSDEDLPDFKGKRVINESTSSPSTSMVKADDSRSPDVTSHYTSSHLEAESKEAATCMCLPLLLPAIHWGSTKTTTHETGLQEPLLPQDSNNIKPPTAEPVILEDSSLIDSKQTTGIPEPVPGKELDDGLQAPLNGAGTRADPALTLVRNSSVDLSNGTQITESKKIHVEGHVSSQKIVTKTERSEEPPEVNVLESNYLFEVDIKDGQLTSTVEKLQPKAPRIDISSCETDSSIDSGGSSTGASVESIVQGDIGDIGAEASGNHLVEQLAEVIKGQLVEENGLASPDLVTQPVQTIIRRTFPAGEIEAQETPQEGPKLEHDFCDCLSLSLPSVRWWGPSRGFGDGLQEHLLYKVEENQSAADRIDVHVSTEGTHVIHEPSAPRRELPTDGTGKRCSCFPSLSKFSFYDVFRDHHVSPEPQLPGTEVDARTPLLGRRPRKTEVVINIGQPDTSITVNATSEGAAVRAMTAARDQILSRGERTSDDYLKSIVHGGLDVTLVSLGVVASGAGGDAKTSTVVVIGLASLVCGLINHFGNIMSLFYNDPTKFQEEVGQGFVHGCLSVLSFLFFGALAPTTFGFSFRNASNRNYKFGTTCVVALVCIVLLGAASARVKSKSAIRVISILVVTGFVAAIAGYETGNYVAQLLEYFGFSSV